MNTQKMKLILGIFLVTLIIPNFSNAYFTTSQSATKITDHTILYTVTYRFGFEDRELYMPIMAKRGLEFDSQDFALGYDIFNNQTVTTIGKTNALVLTDNDKIKIKDGQYYLAPSQVAQFTLVTLLTIPKDIEKSNLSLLVTHLPFTMIKADNNVINTKLNPSELQYYQTPAIKISD